MELCRPDPGKSRAKLSRATRFRRNYPGPNGQARDIIPGRIYYVPVGTMAPERLDLHVLELMV